MQYKDYNGPAEALIRQKLREIEETEQVRILHAVESGSRAWGFASPDSDYDVRFVYIRPMAYYLQLQDKKDFIDWALDETLDINGWDITKALQHFHKSNATLFEWSNSPVVYYTTPLWQQVQAAATAYFSRRSAMYHYYGTASKNFHEHLQTDMVKYKKYFYVLRPILACKWIAQKSSPPPVLFDTLVQEVLEPHMQQVVADLVQKKVQMPETQKAERIDILNEYISQKLMEEKELLETMPDDRNQDWETLNRLFLSMLSEGIREDFLGKR